jgi:hypothetical protein
MLDRPRIIPPTYHWFPSKTWGERVLAELYQKVLWRDWVFFPKPLVAKALSFFQGLQGLVIQAIFVHVMRPCNKASYRSFVSSCYNLK